MYIMNSKVVESLQTQLQHNFGNKQEHMYYEYQFVESLQTQVFFMIGAVGSYV